jgi:hypothetical protein
MSTQGRCEQWTEREWSCWWRPEAGRREGRAVVYLSVRLASRCGVHAATTCVTSGFHRRPTCTASLLPRRSVSMASSPSRSIPDRVTCHSTASTHPRPDDLVGQLMERALLNRAGNLVSFSPHGVEGRTRGGGARRFAHSTLQLHRRPLGCSNSHRRAVRGRAVAAVGSLVLLPSTTTRAAGAPVQRRGARGFAELTRGQLLGVEERARATRPLLVRDGVST